MECLSTFPAVVFFHELVLLVWLLSMPTKLHELVQANLRFFHVDKSRCVKESSVVYSGLPKHSFLSEFSISADAKHLLNPEALQHLLKCCWYLPVLMLQSRN